jgi:toxin ParE1/3/4
MALELSPEAENDLTEIGAYIAQKSGSIETARRFLEKIVETCQRLAENPAMGQLRPEFLSGLYRSFSVGNYVIYFRPVEHGVRIARVLHGARDHDSLL